MHTQKLDAGHPLHTLPIYLDELQIGQLLCLGVLRAKLLSAPHPTSHWTLTVSYVFASRDELHYGGVNCEFYEFIIWQGPDTVMGVQSVEQTRADVDANGRGEMDTNSDPLDAIIEKVSHLAAGGEWESNIQKLYYQYCQS